MIAAWFAAVAERVGEGGLARRRGCGAETALQGAPPPAARALALAERNWPS
jgi:hypothetical protein